MQLQNSCLVAIGLGSNEDSLKNLREALRLLKNQTNEFKVLKVSSIYESDALLLPESPPEWQKPYLNAVVLLDIFEFNPSNFLKKLKLFEVQMGRSIEQSTKKWAPRSIDFDILYAQGVTYDSLDLKIPHKELQNRPFALLPLLEVLPEVNLPRPQWMDHSLKPLNTCKSKKYFWPELAGILNITEDSFSDGGLYLSKENFQKRVVELHRQGADWVDIGAESTRPGANEVPADVEFDRLSRALSWFNELSLPVKISIDCRHNDVVKKLIHKFNVDMINDVSGFANTEMRNLVRESKLPAVAMHSLTVPPQKEITLDSQISPIVQLKNWWREKNFDAKQFIFDPGIGFGKTVKQNLEILQNLDQFFDLEAPIYLGYSRKSFLRSVFNVSSEILAKDLDSQTDEITKQINLAYVQYLRVHHVGRTKKVLAGLT